MSFAKFLTSRRFFIHLLIAVLILLVLIIVVLQGLKMYTRHGESEPVPDFAGMTKEDAVRTAEQNNLRIEFIDSLFVEGATPGSVVDQVPEAGHPVKVNRKIFLTTNSIQPELVSLPRLVNISLRQAQVLVENSGLQIGQIRYQPSEYSNLVLEVQIDSTRISAGKKLAKGTMVDLVVGKTGNMQTSLPDLTGLTLDEAKSMLTESMLNSGVLIYDASVLTSEDSVQAVIWRQQPDPRITGSVPAGSSVDLWMTVDQLKVNDVIEEGF